MLKAKAHAATAQAVREELAPLLPPHQTEWIDTLIRASLLRVAERIARLD